MRRLFPRLLLAFAATSGLSSAIGQTLPATREPVLTFERADMQKRFGPVYEAALRNLLEINTIPDTRKAHDPLGRMTASRRFVRAGSAYQTPWTRDASINAWAAASLLEPDAARNTLWAVCERLPDGAIVVQRDNQWWDQVIWIVAAWDHYATTGGKSFLEQAYPVAAQTLRDREADRFNAERGLFMGPAFFADGIAAYPPPEFDAKNPSSFVLDHPYTAELMALSTNCVYREAYRAAAEMASALGKSEESAALRKRSDDLRDRINARFWSPERKAYAYFLHGAGPEVGTLYDAQEGAGVSFAILFDIVPPEEAATLVAKVHTEPSGIVTLWPHLPQFDDEHPGRHNVMVWPLVSGLWACATAKAGALDAFAKQTEAFADLVTASDYNFYEIYDARTGKPDGGWQCGRPWPPLGDQTWSASMFLATMHRGLFGLRFGPDGLRLEPVLPEGWGPVTLSGLRYREMTLEVRLTGQGKQIRRLTLDGDDCLQIPATLAGEHRVEVELE